MGDSDSDEVQIRGLELLAYCGVLDEEQVRRQPFRLDIDLQADLRAAGRSDDLNDTIDYGAVADRVVEVLGAERYLLVERMAQRVADVAFEWPAVHSVTVRVKKLRPPIPVHADSTGVRIHRRRSDGNDPTS